MSRKNFLQSAAILALAGVIVRLIGAIYRIPLVGLIGTYGIGLYSQIFPAYSLLLTLSTAGIPGAISKMVSERLVHDDDRNARRVFRVSLLVLVGIGVVSTAVMTLGSAQIAVMIGHSKDSVAMLQPSVIAIAPALLLVAMITAFRGYFQGYQNMTPTAVSQVWEQLIKFFPGFLLVSFMAQAGVQYGASGAMWGVTMAEAVALVYLILVYALKRRTEGHGSRRQAEAYRAIAKQLLALALPMLVGALFLPLSSLLDTIIVKGRLLYLSYPDKTATILLGLLSGIVAILVNVPSVISLSLSTSLIPSIADSQERGDNAAVARKTWVGLKMTTLVSMPCAVGMAVLARPIIVLLFDHGNAFDSPEQITITAELLAVSALSVILLSIVQSTNGALQGIGRVKVPMYSLAAGAIVKVILNYVLVGIPQLNIHGAPIGTIALYGLSAGINLYFVRRYTGVRLHPMALIVRPGLACAGMGAAAWIVQWGLRGPLGANFATVVAIVAAVPVYLAFSLLLGAVGREELLFFPKGERLAAGLKRLHLLKD